MKAVRLWSIRNAGWLKRCYDLLESTLALFNPPHPAPTVRVEYGAFQTLGESCLAAEEGSWAPDFSAHMLEQVGEAGGNSSGDTRVLKIPSSVFQQEFR